jgi:CheY-like chemotaxis protein
MPRGSMDRILIVDDNPVLREHLAASLRAKGLEVVTAATGEQGFIRLRDWSKPIGWLYTKATLPGLVDGWILADEYHDTHPDRSAVIFAAEPRHSLRDLILDHPSPAVIVDTIGQAIRSVENAPASAMDQRDAA